MRKLTVTLLFVFALMVFGFTGCQKEQAVAPLGSFNCDTIPASFANDIKPIFDNNCTNTGCHAGNNNFGGFLWETYDDIADTTNHSTLLSVLKHESGFSPMPSLQPQLPDSLINKITCWIQNGALNN